MMTNLFRVISVAAMAAVLTVSIVTAEARRSETEREVLARAVQELELIDAILADAERRANVSTRIYFDYGQLREELAAVKGGISEYVGGDRLQPREIAPLSASYTRITGKE